MDTTAIATTAIGTDIERVLVGGDLSKLTPEQRVRYVGAVCQSIGLNPLTRPFEFISLGGRLVLYAKRDAADQLRKINGISVEVVSRSIDDGILTVHVRAPDKAGRRDEDFGAVSVASLKGEALANAVLKAVTKAKRRVTLSISGLGFLDESEVDSIPGARVEPLPPVVVEPEPPAGNGVDWPERIAECQTVAELDALRDEIRTHYGKAVPRHIAEAWKARRGEVQPS
jgi:hypothetical protein